MLFFIDKERSFVAFYHVSVVNDCLRLVTILGDSLRCFLAFFFFLSTPLFLWAEKPSSAKLLYVGLGIYDIIHDPHNALIQLEYRSFLPKYRYLRPLIGAMATDKASLYVYGGIAGDIFLGEKFVLTPSFAPGFYFQGKGKDLHFPLEFRSSLELSYIFQNQGRFGAQFYHMSNASLGKKNPGAESLVFFYAIPL